MATVEAIMTLLLKAIFLLWLWKFACGVTEQVVPMLNNSDVVDVWWM